MNYCTMICTMLSLFSMALLLCASPGHAAERDGEDCLVADSAMRCDSVPKKGRDSVGKKDWEVPPVVHSQAGDRSPGIPGELSIENLGKKQQFNWSDKSNFDEDIFSPKSVIYHPSGKKYYVNSLEGCKTVVYDAGANAKLAVVKHTFPSGQSPLWATPSDFYTFTHYENGASRAFSGKPVEAAFSHGGRYLWVPYYRRTFDINAQDPSAVAVIDTRMDTIVRMFDTGPLPKMIAVSPDNRYVAITHWGDNTVGLIDISDKDMTRWHHLQPLVAGSKLKLDFPLDHTVDRDKHSGLKLRGTVFTPDAKYLLVSAMGGPLQVFDLTSMTWLGSVMSAYSVRHLVIANGHLYGSQNVAGSVIDIPLDSIINAAVRAKANGTKTIAVKGWRTCKVTSGPRTLEPSPDGKYLFVACNSSSKMCVVDAAAMQMVDTIRVDSYPVGLAVSPLGDRVIVTSQGRKGHGGNAVNIFKIDRPDYLPAPLPETVTSEEEADGMMEEVREEITPVLAKFNEWKPFLENVYELRDTLWFRWIPIVRGVSSLVILVIVLFLVFSRKKRNNNKNV